LEGDKDEIRSSGFYGKREERKGIYIYSPCLALGLLRTVLARRPSLDVGV
jgi:hypothetical protein